MLYIQDIEEEMDKANITPEKIKEITETVSACNFIYAYPYQLKLFLAKYANFVKKYYSLNDNQ